MSYIGPLTQNLLEVCTNEIKKKDTKEKIMKNLIEPVVNEFFKRYSVYVISFMLIHIITIILLIYIIYNLKK